LLTIFVGVMYFLSSDGSAAAIGKVGAFAGTWIFPILIDAFPEGATKNTGVSAPPPRTFFHDGISI
jgi:hypothetical protein